MADTKKIVVPKWLKKHSISDSLVSNVDISIAVAPEPFNYPAKNDHEYKMLIADNYAGLAVKLRCENCHEQYKTYNLELIARSKGIGVVHLSVMPNRPVMNVVHDITDLANPQYNISRITSLLKLASLSHVKNVHSFAKDAYDATVAAYVHLFKREAQRTNDYFNGKFKAGFK